MLENSTFTLIGPKLLIVCLFSVVTLALILGVAFQVKLKNSRIG